MKAMRQFIGVLGVMSSLSAETRLPSKYLIQYGNPNAPIQIVEYFGFACEPCIQTIVEDFASIRKRYIDSGEICWVFHPYPVDLLTVQAMVCLEQLPGHQKQVFFEAVMEEQYASKWSQKIELLKAAALALDLNITSHVEDKRKLQATEAFKAAFTYQQQALNFSGTPTIQINGEIKDAFPTRERIDQWISEARRNHS